MASHYDVIVIGTGAGGGALAHALAPLGQRILLLERGDRIPREPANWSASSTFLQKRYQTQQQWLNVTTGAAFRPSLCHAVGGSTKIYGAALIRMRNWDFDQTQYSGGVSPAWPLDYNDFEPYYSAAENLYWVHGQRGSDPTEGWASQDYPYSEISNETKIQAVSEQLASAGLSPFTLPMGINRHDNGPCIRCSTCDGYPCQLDAKADAQTCCIDPALQHPNVTLQTGTEVQRLVTDSTGTRVTRVEAIAQGKATTFSAEIVVVACGAVNSAALLLQSANGHHPRGLGNSSGLVGQNLMKHNITKLFAVNWSKNTTTFQKTLALNDFYRQHQEPSGHVHLMGKHTWEMMRDDFPGWLPRFVLSAIAHRSIDWWIQSEDLPKPSNRVTVNSHGQIAVHYQSNNQTNHRKLVYTFKSILQELGYPLLIERPVSLANFNHQMGTCRFGTDPRSSVLDLNCRSHDIENLYVVDSSFFPSSSATNPTLTIVANALRVAESIKKARGSRSNVQTAHSS